MAECVQGASPERQSHAFSRFNSSNRRAYVSEGQSVTCQSLARILAWDVPAVDATL